MLVDFLGLYPYYGFKIRTSRISNPQTLFERADDNASQRDGHKTLEHPVAADWRFFVVHAALV